MPRGRDKEICTAKGPSNNGGRHWGYEASSVRAPRIIVTTRSEEGNKDPSKELLGILEPLTVRV